VLESLTVRDYALIDHLEVSFGPHLNVLSGETGAGKSIIIGALGLLLGSRAPAADIRSGAASAEVSAVVCLSQAPAEVRAWLEQRELPVEEERIIVRRVVRRSGRSSGFIGSVPVQTAQLAALGQGLFDLHGQHEHQSLLREDQQRRLLDHFAGLRPLARRLAAVHARLAAARAQAQELEEGVGERSRQVDLLRHAAEEIAAAGLRLDEEEELEQEQRRLTAFERISTTARLVYERTAEAHGGAVAMLRGVLEDLQELASLDASVDGYRQQVETAFYELEDAAEGVRRYHSSLHYDTERLAAIAERLELIRSLQRKYGASVAAVLTYAERAHDELAALERCRDAGAAAARQVAQLSAELARCAAELSRQRGRAGARLRGLVQDALGELGMPKARFAVALNPRTEGGAPSIAAGGAETVSFLISANAGEPLKPLRSIASGGEISRVMLAIKSVFADSDTVATLVFDEVDAGIGGAVAIAVGEKLARLAQRRQILCITHLATVAARADTHLRVFKREREGRTVTGVAAVSGRQRVAEVARMLSGDDSVEVSLRHAADLLARHAC
jgi:DNA repair protein RecN (Recombination protein N)